MRITFLSKWLSVVLFVVLSAAVFYLFPFLFKQVVVWQREFNQLMSGYLHQIKQNPGYAGSWLIVVSFVYGVFHALGPGHGKFIIAGYLSTHQSKIKTSMYLTLLSSLMQGLVAVTAVSIVVVVLNLSSVYFRLSQLWLERFAFILLILLGLTWIWQSFKNFSKKGRTFSGQAKLQIKSIRSIAPAPQSAVSNQQNIHRHDAHCGCGHQHVPDQAQLARANSVKSQLLIILSIGMRPCTGAIFVLFLAYTLNLFSWGIAATFAMSLGTGITLSGFALLVRYARKIAVRLGQWYLAPQITKNLDMMVKLIAGVFVVFLATGLLYNTTLPVAGGAVLFGR